jgi:DNA-binding transcriptional MocR family regulator
LINLILFLTGVCQELIKLARKYDFLIACDDVYNLLYFDDKQPLKRLYEYDDFNDLDFKGHVVSNGTFSKLLSPGLRVGWIEAPPRIVDKFLKSGWMSSGGAANNFGSGLIAAMIELGSLSCHVERTKESLKAQRDAICDALEKSLPSSCSFLRPKGGYFLWIKLPESCNGEELVQYVLQNYKIFIIIGTRFSIKNQFKNCVRVSFAFHPPEKLSEAGLRLGKAIDEFLKTEA